MGCRWAAGITPRNFSDTSGGIDSEDECASSGGALATRQESFGAHLTSATLEASDY
jgi:hypothetical protein